MKNNEHPFFRPLWRRIAVVAACFIWAGIEYIGGSPTWTMMALAFGLYGVWQFFYAYKPVDEAKPPVDDEPKE